MSSVTGAFTDAQAISDLVQRERHWRDRNDWDRMAAAYADDSIVTVAWFRGSGADYVEVCKSGGRGGVTKHRMSPSLVEVTEGRALAETSLLIETRIDLQGVEVDLVSSCRYLQRLVRVDSEWLIQSVECICERDAVRAVHPERIVSIDPQLLDTFRPSYRFVSYSLAVAGLPVRMDLPGDDLPETTAALYRAARSWLAGDAQAWA